MMNYPFAQVQTQGENFGKYDLRDLAGAEFAEVSIVILPIRVIGMFAWFELQEQIPGIFFPKFLKKLPAFRIEVNKWCLCFLRHLTDERRIFCMRRQNIACVIKSSSCDRGQKNGGGFFVSCF